MLMRTRRFVAQGFTIVELLIVIVVIGILAALVISTYTSAQSRARDNVRRADIQSLAKAIELFYAEKGHYPMSGGWCTQIAHPTYTQAFKNEISPYMSKIPGDPQFKDTYQDYFYRNVNDQSYYLYAELEGEERADDGFTGCSRIGDINNEYDLRYPAF